MLYSEFLKLELGSVVKKSTEFPLFIVTKRYPNGDCKAVPISLYAGLSPVILNDVTYGIYECCGGVNI